MSVFSQINDKDKLYQGKFYFLVFDKFPASPGHILIISKEERADFFSLTSDEKNELNQMILKSKEILDNQYSPEGYNVGFNCGEAAGQTVMHFHCHVIPRYHGDMENPRGGVRHCVAGKGYY